MRRAIAAEKAEYSNDDDDDYSPSPAPKRRRAAAAPAARSPSITSQDSGETDRRKASGAVATAPFSGDGGDDRALVEIETEADNIDDGYRYGLSDHGLHVALGRGVIVCYPVVLP